MALLSSSVRRGPLKMALQWHTVAPPAAVYRLRQSAVGIFLGRFKVTINCGRSSPKSTVNSDTNMPDRRHLSDAEIIAS